MRAFSLIGLALASFIALPSLEAKAAGCSPPGKFDYPVAKGHFLIHALPGVLVRDMSFGSSSFSLITEKGCKDAVQYSASGSVEETTQTTSARNCSRSLPVGNRLTISVIKAPRITGCSATMSGSVARAHICIQEETRVRCFIATGTFSKTIIRSASQ